MTNEPTLTPSEVSPRKRLRVALIGSGRRIRNNYLPALSCLADEFEVVQIHSRTPERLNVTARHWNIPTAYTIDELQLSEIDVLAISIPTDQNSVVLEKLLPQAAGHTLVIDTPIAWRLGELRRILPLLRAFKRVIVTEDYMNFPQFQLLRTAVEHELVGCPLNLNLYNLGFLYHGLALIRSFKSFQYVRRTWRTKIGDGSIVFYQLPNSFQGCVIGPYLREGNIILIGTDAVVSDARSNSDHKGSGKRFLKLNAIRTDSAVEGFAIADGRRTVLELRLPQVRRLMSLDFEDKSDLNLMRSCGLMEVFRSIAVENINNRYSFYDALYDSFISRAGTRLPMLLDPFAYLGSNGFRFASRLI